MSSRRQEVLEAAVGVLATQGMHGLTHRAIDREAQLPQGSTSNVFRTRAALAAAVAAHIAARRLESRGSTLSLPWLELLMESVRNPEVHDAIAPLRREMISQLGAARSDGISLTNEQLAALLTGLEFAETVTGQNLADQVLSMLGTRITPTAAAQD